MIGPTNSSRTSFISHWALFSGKKLKLGKIIKFLGTCAYNFLQGGGGSCFSNPFNGSISRGPSKPPHGFEDLHEEGKLKIRVSGVGGCQWLVRVVNKYDNAKD